jgi:N-acetylglucosaminyldiphosphoundecaprenol N-acetyl-beta-D-mannosaminyltransferase
LRPDFQRDVYCVLGLPFDRVDLATTQRRLTEAIAQGRRCALTTPNLNFAIAALSDATYRNAVWRSDLSVADGMPLVWAARAMGLPFPERVPGSTLFENLRAAVTTRPVKVYFFGGPDGAAEAACKRLNAETSGMRCVGFDSPGFGNVEELSSADRIGAINASGAEFIVVSVGARKGTLWMEHNRDVLKAPVMAPLGAVVNFVAGSVKRAPAAVQGLGLEWAWRIFQEPALWRRYAYDAVALTRLTLTRVAPLVWARRSRGVSAQSIDALRVHLSQTESVALIRLEGDAELAHLAPLRAALGDAVGGDQAVTLDLSRLRTIDGAAIALLGLLHAHCDLAGRRWRVQNPQPRVRRSFVLHCAEFLLEDPRLGLGMQAKT